MKHERLAGQAVVLDGSESEARVHAVCLSSARSSSMTFLDGTLLFSACT